MNAASLRCSGFPRNIHTCDVFFQERAIALGFFPWAPGFRSWCATVERLAGPEASLFSSFRALPFPFPLGGSHGAWWNSGLSLNSRLWAKSVFPLFLRFRWFRCFCSSVGQRNPCSRSPLPIFFSLSFPPFYPLRIYIRSVSRLRDTKCSLQQRASMTDIIERNAENALCSDTCSFYYEGMNSLVRSFGVGICLKRWLLSATIISWREFFHAERYAVVSTQQYSIFLANHHRFCLLHIFGSCRVITPNTCLEGVDQLD